MDLQKRAVLHNALGDQTRLLLVDHLARSDRTVQELLELTSLSGNLLAHHLNVLQSAGLIERRPSQGDRRRRYVVLHRDILGGLLASHPLHPRLVLFFCSHNSARSQYAAARWEATIGLAATSAGSEPAQRVHPHAIKVAAERGLDLRRAVPRRFEKVEGTPDLLISVCDRAREGELPPVPERIHWSIPDPVRQGGVEAFRLAFAEIDHRIAALTGGNR